MPTSMPSLPRFGRSTTQKYATTKRPTGKDNHTKTPTSRTTSDAKKQIPKLDRKPSGVSSPAPAKLDRTPSGVKSPPMPKLERLPSGVKSPAPKLERAASGLKSPPPKLDRPPSGVKSRPASTASKVAENVPGAKQAGGHGEKGGPVAAQRGWAGKLRNLVY